jgi:hypothetical protein
MDTCTGQVEAVIPSLVDKFARVCDARLAFRHRPLSKVEFNREAGEFSVPTFDLG